MHVRSIQQALRLAGGQVATLVLVCLALGLFALTFDPGAAIALLLAGIGALVVFLLIADAVVPAGSSSTDIPARVKPVDRPRRHR
jgi:hypothetical protein